MGIFDIFRSKEDLEKKKEDKRKQDKAEFLYGLICRSDQYKSDNPVELESLLGLFLREVYRDPAYPFSKLHLTGVTKPEILEYLLQSVELREFLAQENELLQKDIRNILRNILSLIKNTGDDPGSYSRMYEQQIPGLISIHERLSAQGKVKETELFNNLVIFVRDIAAGNNFSAISEWRDILMKIRD